MITPTRTPVRTKPDSLPNEEPEKRYNPDTEHCPTQWDRTIRRIAPLIP